MASSSGEIDKQKYLTSKETLHSNQSQMIKQTKFPYLAGKETLPYNQSQTIKQAKFAYSHLGKSYEKQSKIIEGQG